MAAVAARYGTRPGSADGGPLTWPVVLPLDEQHRVAASLAALAGDASASRSGVRMIAAVYHETSRAPAQGASPVWKPVHDAPAGPSRGGNNASVGRDGSRGERDGDTRTGVQHNADGSTDVFADGNDIHIFPPSSSSGTPLYAQYNGDGSSDVHYKNGPTDHLSADGKGDYTDWGNHKRSDYDGSGSETITDTNDGSIKIVDKDGTTVEIPGLKSLPKGMGYYHNGWHDPDSQKARKPAGGTGEPHYLTQHGVNITTQAAGEFALVAGVPGHEVQARQQPWVDSPRVSAITALACRVNHSKVEVRLDGTVLVDGQPAVDGEFVQGDVPGGGAVGVWRVNGQLRNVVVVWPDLSALWITRAWSYLSFVVEWRTPQPAQRGLLGANDVDATNDLVDRQGARHTTDPASVASLVDSWRITSTESLFTYAPGQSTATFTLKDFPHPAPPVDMQAGVAATTALPPGPVRDMCAYDIALTGDQRFLDGCGDFAGHLAASSARADASAPLSSVPPDVGTQSFITVSAAEMKNATPIEFNTHIKETFAPGQSKTYKLVFQTSDVHGAMSNLLEIKQPYEAGMAGYAWFDSEGHSFGPVTPAVNDRPGFTFPAGTFYLKIVGPGIIDITTVDYGK
jgi:hypothetical protein